MTGSAAATLPAPGLEDLVSARLLLPLGTEGLYGFGAGFEEVTSAVASLLRRIATGDGAEEVAFPPVMARSVQAELGYLRSFPHLAGSLHVFSGDDGRHRRILRSADPASEWVEALVPAETVMCSSACHPLYTTVGRVPPEGRTWSLVGWVYRHEPSRDPARMQAFRQMEFVFVGPPEGTLAHAERWRQRFAEIADTLRLEASSAPASDPFFGRAGSVLASSQLSSGSKVELLAATGPDGRPTAIASVNHHGDHFTHAANIVSEGGEALEVTSACTGFGLERVALALFARHGVERSGWPIQVRRVLWDS